MSRLAERILKWKHDSPKPDGKPKREFHFALMQSPSTNLFVTELGLQVELWV